MHQRLREAVAAGTPVILDATGVTPIRWTGVRGSAQAAACVTKHCIEKPAVTSFALAKLVRTLSVDCGLLAIWVLVEYL